MNDASIGFPWNRVQAARSYLLALKPWLAPLVLRVVIVPVDHPPVNGTGWLLAPQVDASGRIYLDRSFCLTQPLEVLAGAIEHECAKISRNIFARLSWVSVDDWDDIATPAFQMEIVDAMEREGEYLTLPRIEQRLARSNRFTVDDFDDWEIKGPPSVVAAGAFTPWMLGLPPGLSAERYAQILLDARDRAVFESDEVSDAGAEQPESGDAPGSETSDALPTTGSGSEQSSPDQNEPTSDSPERGEASSGSEGTPSEGGGDSGPGGEPDGEPDAPDGEESDDHAAGATSTDDEPDDDAEEVEDWQEGLFAVGDTPPSAPPEPVDDGQADDHVAPPESGHISTTEMIEAAGGAKAITEAMEAALANPDTFAWSTAVPHYANEFAADVAPPREMNAPPVSALDMRDALNETAMSTLQYASNGNGFGIDVRNIEVAHERARSMGLSWEQHLARVVSSCLTSERIKGASDLTYSVANPNQPEVGVRLMGMTDYAPSVTFIQDVSGSMTNTMALAMDTMSDLMVALVGRLQARSAWVTVANDIIAVGETALMSKDVRAQWLYGGGGTDLGGVIAGLMGGPEPARFEGRRLPVPDLLVVSTDAMFHWPPARPSRAHKLVVVVYAERQVELLPDWVDRDREVVLAAN